MDKIQIPTDSSLEKTFWDDYYTRNPKTLSRVQVVCTLCSEEMIVYHVLLPDGREIDKHIHKCFRKKQFQESIGKEQKTLGVPSFSSFKVHELFPDRPKVVQDHHEKRKFCSCDDCLQFFKEGIYDEEKD